MKTEVLETIKQRIQEKEESIQRLEISTSIKCLTKFKPYVIFNANMVGFVYNTNEEEKSDGILLTIGVSFDPKDISEYHIETATEILNHLREVEPTKEFMILPTNKFEEKLLEREREDLVMLTNVLNIYK